LCLASMPQLNSKLKRFLAKSAGAALHLFRDRGYRGLRLRMCPQLALIFFCPGPTLNAASLPFNDRLGFRDHRMPRPFLAFSSRDVISGVNHMVKAEFALIHLRLPSCSRNRALGTQRARSSRSGIIFFGSPRT